MFSFYVFGSVKEDSNITSTKVWSSEEENKGNSEDNAGTSNVDTILSESEESPQRGSSSQTICNDDNNLENENNNLENENSNNISDMAKLSIDSNGEYIENDRMVKQLPPKSPFFLKQLDLTDDMINFGKKSSENSAGKTKSKKSVGSPSQRKTRGFSTLSSNRSVLFIFLPKFQQLLIVDYSHYNFVFFMSGYIKSLLICKKLKIIDQGKKS